MAPNIAYPNAIALVTGASTGIGESLCRILIDRGWTVIGVARSQDKLQSMEQELGEGRFLPRPCDVGDGNAIVAVSEQLQKQGIVPSLFFLNAGMAGKGAMETRKCCEIDKYKQTMAVNYFGVLEWVKAWEQLCIDNGGANFVATSSKLALYAPPSASAYAASKIALMRAFQGLTLNYYGTNLRFSIVVPGPVDTAGLKGKWPFTWSADRMANYMVECAMKGKRHCSPQPFYSFLLRVAHWLPIKLVFKLLRIKP